MPAHVRIDEIAKLPTNELHEEIGYRISTLEKLEQPHTGRVTERSGETAITPETVQEVIIQARKTLVIGDTRECQILLEELDWLLSVIAEEGESNARETVGLLYACYDDKGDFLAEAQDLSQASVKIRIEEAMKEYLHPINQGIDNVMAGFTQTVAALPHDRERAVGEDLQLVKDSMLRVQKQNEINKEFVYRIADTLQDKSVVSVTGETFDIQEQFNEVVARLDEETAADRVAGVPEAQLAEQVTKKAEEIIADRLQTYIGEQLTFLENWKAELGVEKQHADSLIEQYYELTSYEEQVTHFYQEH